MWRTTQIVYPLYASANIFKNNYTLYILVKNHHWCVWCFDSPRWKFFSLSFSLYSPTTPMMKNYCVLSCNIDAPPFNLKSALVKSTKHTQQINPLCKELLESAFLKSLFCVPILKQINERALTQTHTHTLVMLLIYFTQYVEKENNKQKQI